MAPAALVLVPVRDLARAQARAPGLPGRAQALVQAAAPGGPG